MATPRSFPYVAQDVLPGSRYRLLQTLGVGGMAAVWEAENAAIGRIVAIKVLFPEVAAKGHFDEAHMNREARILSGLHARTPYVVDVLDAGVTADVHRLPYIVMERLSGMTLRDSIRRKTNKGQKFAILEVTQLCLEMTMALAHAHENEIVHRDMKPENVYLHRGREGEKPSVKVLDFGISAWADDAATRSPGVKGTLRYMAPEQFRRERVTPATDTYAMGLMAFELLTLGSPFEIGKRKLERAEFEHVHCHVTAPRASDFRDDVPPALVDVIASCLQKLPERRPQNGTALTRVFKQLRDELHRPVKSISHIAAISEPGSSPLALEGTTDVGAAPFLPLAPEPPQIVRGDVDVPHGAITSVPGIDSATPSRTGAERSEVFVSRHHSVVEPPIPTPPMINVAAPTPVMDGPYVPALSVDRTVADSRPPFDVAAPSLPSPPTPRANVAPLQPEHTGILVHRAPPPIVAPAPAPAPVRIAEVQLAPLVPPPSENPSEGHSFEPVTDDPPPPSVITTDRNPYVLPTVAFSAFVALATALAWIFVPHPSTELMTAVGMASPIASAFVVPDASSSPPPAVTASASVAPSGASSR